MKNNLNSSLNISVEKKTHYRWISNLISISYYELRVVVSVWYTAYFQANTM